MSELLLLKDPCRCPACGQRRADPIRWKCISCGITLFSHTGYGFENFERETGCVYWWAFDKERGWMYRDHFIVKDAKPLPRDVALKPIPKDYGKHTTPGEVAARGGKL